VFLFVLCTACASHSPPAPPPPDPVSQIPALETRIFEIVNNQRHQIDPNAAQLLLDSELVDIARKHSADMAAKNAFEDGSGDPHISATRLMAIDADFQGLLGENVGAQRYFRASGIDVDRSAKMIVDSWISSPSNRQNLSFADYAKTGVGIALSGDTVFVTELFATQSMTKAGAKHANQRVKSFPSAEAAKAEKSQPPVAPDTGGAAGLH
jgi:uncharacterized protein YkwD